MRGQMPVGPSPNTGQPTKSDSVAISTRYSNLSTFCWPPNTAGVGGLPHYRPTAYFCRTIHSTSDQHGRAATKGKNRIQHRGTEFAKIIFFPLRVLSASVVSSLLDQSDWNRHWKFCACSEKFKLSNTETLLILAVVPGERRSRVLREIQWRSPPTQPRETDTTHRQSPACARRL
jgi:hypothetical protein